MAFDSAQPSPILHRNQRPHTGPSLVKLSGVFSNPSAIAKVAGLASNPEIFQASGNRDNTSQCVLVSPAARRRIEHWCAIRTPNWLPDFQDVYDYRKLAEMNLNAWLGESGRTWAESTLPLMPWPEKGEWEYPRRYFLYGRSAVVDKMQSLLGIEVSLVDATVEGGKMGTWQAERQRGVGLVDGKERVSGKLYMVETKRVEDRLRLSWGELFEVVRCYIECAGTGAVLGAMFRYTGELDEVVGPRRGAVPTREVEEDYWADVRR